MPHDIDEATNGRFDIPTMHPTLSVTQAIGVCSNGVGEVIFIIWDDPLRSSLIFVVARCVFGKTLFSLDTTLNERCCVT